MSGSEVKEFDWTPIKYAAGFGVTLALADKFGVIGMVQNPITSSLRSMIGEGVAGDVGAVISFGLLYFLFDGYIKQYLNPSS